MRSVRKHVDRTSGHAAVAGLVHQKPGVARQRRRVAAHIDDAARQPIVRREFLVAMQIRSRLGERERAFARRVDEPAIGAAEREPYPPPSTITAIASTG